MSSSLATFALRETAPDLGARAVRGQIIHVDAILGQERQRVLSGADQAGTGVIIKRAAQGAKPCGVAFVFGEVQRADEVIDRDRLRRACGRA